MVPFFKGLLLSCVPFFKGLLLSCVPSQSKKLLGSILLLKLTSPIAEFRFTLLLLPTSLQGIRKQTGSLVQLVLLGSLGVERHPSGLICSAVHRIGLRLSAGLQHLTVLSGGVCV